MPIHASRAKLRLFALLLACIALAPSRALADDDDRRGLRRPFDRIVVFGTSLSDPGNAFALSHNHLKPPYVSPALNPLTLTPESEWPYAVGGNHFSNGATWAEQLGRAGGLSENVKPAFVNPTHRSSNYAVGGSRARVVQDEVSLSQQVTEFLRDAGPHVSPRALYVIEIGGNDVRDALEGDAAAIPQALTSLVEQIGRLYGAGARTFLVWNVPNLGRAPAIRALDAFLHETQGLPAGTVIAGATQASMGYNAALPLFLSKVSPLAGIKIIQFDAFGTLESIVASPNRYRLQNVTDACIRPGTRPPSRCENQDQYLFWDGIHPTRAGHAVIAVLVGKMLVEAVLHDD